MRILADSKFENKNPNLSMQIKLLISLLHKDVAQGLNGFVAIISPMFGCISARVVFVGVSSSTKANARIIRAAIILIVACDSDPCFRIATAGYCIESFPVAVWLQRGTWNQRLPFVTTQRSGTVRPIGDQGVKWAGFRIEVDWNELGLSFSLHSETDFGKRCGPVSW